VRCPEDTKVGFGGSLFGFSEAFGVSLIAGLLSADFGA